MNRQKLYLIVGVMAFVMVGAFIYMQGRDTAQAETDDGGVVRQTISPANYQAQFIDNLTPHVLIDVRTPQEFDSGHIANSINISVDQIASRLSEIPRDQPIVVYCRSGNRSAQASQILSNAGYTVIYDLGGINQWTAQGFPLE